MDYTFYYIFPHYWTFMVFEKQTSRLLQTSFGSQQNCFNPHGVIPAYD